VIDVTEHVVALDGSTPLDREVVGNKGLSIVRMVGLGLPVPPAFALPIDECRRFHAAGGRLEDGVWRAVLEGIAGLEERTGRRLGDPEAPLLVSVRSGAAVSMPGMMDTILNLGMTDAVEAGLARLSGDRAFAHGTHVRFLREFGRTVLGADIEPPAEEATAGKVRAAVSEDTGEQVPDHPHDQLRAAIRAVFQSWSTRRAKAYRKHWGIPEDGGTAVIVQAMVFGNLGGDSGTGVIFSRNPLSGVPEPYGEWLPGGQGEDVVSGTHDPLPLDALHDRLPRAHDRLLEAAALLEQEYADVQDIEFTIESGALYLLQTRAAKRSPAAAVRTAVDFATEGAIDRQEALRRVSVEQVATVLAPRLPDAVTAVAEVVARGTPACPGVASGRAIRDSEAAEAALGDTVLVRPTTSPEDVAGMIAARAVVTERGGSTSHAAVVTRALGRPSVVGAGEGVADALADRELTVDGTTGVVYAGRLPTEEVPPSDVAGLGQLLDWARELGRVAVLDAAEDVLDLDAEGVGVEADGPPDVDGLTKRLRGAAAARGSVLATPAGARAVLAAGVPAVVRQPGQPAATLLLLLVQADSDTDEEERSP
jgi:pyruvate, orthophosphate dikinase